MFSHNSKQFRLGNYHIKKSYPFHTWYSDSHASRSGYRYFQYFWALASSPRDEHWATRDTMASHLRIYHRKIEPHSHLTRSACRYDSRKMAGQYRWGRSIQMGYCGGLRDYPRGRARVVGDLELRIRAYHLDDVSMVDGAVGEWSEGIYGRIATSHHIRMVHASGLGAESLHELTCGACPEKRTSSDRGGDYPLEYNFLAYFKVITVSNTGPEYIKYDDIINFYWLMWSNIFLFSLRDSFTVDNLSIAFLDILDSSRIERSHLSIRILSSSFTRISSSQSLFERRIFVLRFFWMSESSFIVRRVGVYLRKFWFSIFSS